MHLAALLLAGLTHLALPATAGPSTPEASSEEAFSISIALPRDETPFVARGATATFPGASLHHRVGEPALPLETVTVLLPLGARTEQLSVRLVGVVEREVARPVDVLPAPPATTDGRIEWPVDRALVDGRDVSVYGRDTHFPASHLVEVRTGRLRDAALVTVRYAPYRYAPPSRALSRLTEGTLLITCPVDSRVEAAHRRRQPAVPRFASTRRTIAALALNAPQELATSDEPGEPRALLRGHSAQARAQADAGASAGAGGPDGARSTYLVVTTRAFRARSQVLTAFLAAKEALGFQPRVATEDEWGGGLGDVAAERLRAYLRRSALPAGVEYVLLIGDPHPDTGDVPMKRTWPRSNAHTFVEHRDAPTDQFYAELSGDWDADADGLAGEEDDDLPRPGGPDAFSELFVGRIPFIDGDVQGVDAVLSKSIAHGAEEDAAWRRSALLAMVPSDQWTPAYQLGERVRELITEPSGFSAHRVYATVNPYASFSPIQGVPSVETMPCTEDTVLDAWRSRPYGLVLWWTHGAPRVANDIFSTSKVPLLAEHNERSPAFIYQSSCHNAAPDVPDNLAHSLLRRGAVTTVSATHASWYYTGQTDFAATDSAPGLGFAYTRNLVRGGLSAGEALAMARAEAFSGAGLWMNFVVLNLFGDPSLRLAASGDSPPRLACPASVHLGAVRQHRPKPLQLRCANAGGGTLRIRAASSSDDALALHRSDAPIVEATLDPTRFAAGSGQALVVTVDSNGGSASITVRFSVEPPFLAGPRRLFLAGAAFNDWSPVSPGHELTLVDDYTWELELDVDRALHDTEYKLAANGGWDDNWGGGDGADALLQHRAPRNATVSLAPGPTLLRVQEGPRFEGPVRVQWLPRLERRSVSRTCCDDRWLPTTGGLVGVE